MKKSNLLVLALTFVVIFLSSCTGDKPKLNVEFSGTNTGWYGDTVKFNVIVDAGTDYSLKITNNHDFVLYEQDFGAGLDTIEYGYVVPTDLTEGDVVTVTFNATSKESSKSDIVTKDIVITANGNGQVVYHNGIITTNETWLASNTHIVNGDFVVSGCKVLIEPGTVIKVQNTYSIEITGQNSELIANGTAENPIIFTSASATVQPGDWKGLVFSNGINTTTSLKYCKILFAGSSAGYGAVTMNNASITMENCEISNSNSYGVKANNNAFISFKNNTINNCANYSISINAENAHTLGTGNQITSTKGIELEPGTVKVANAVWNYQTTPYVIAGGVHIEGANNPKLTINKGTSILFITSGRIIVGGDNTFGTLKAQGTADSLITFSSASATPQAGDWDYIMFDEGSTDCILEYCDIKYGGGNSSWGMVDLEIDAKVSINNCTFSNSQYYAVETENCNNGFVEFSNNTLTKTSGHIMKIKGMHAGTIGSGNVFNVDNYSGIFLSSNGAGYVYITENTNIGAQTCPYFFDDEMIIKNNATLTLAPGTVFKVLGSIKIAVGYDTQGGKLIAEGTPTNKIIFTSGASNPQKGDWRYIYFSPSAMSGSTLSNCEISYGGNSNTPTDYGNIYVEPCGSGNPVISNCEIHHSNNYGIFLGKVNSAWGDPAISGNTFHDNNREDVGQE